MVGSGPCSRQEGRGRQQVEIADGLGVMYRPLVRDPGGGEPEMGAHGAALHVLDSVGTMHGASHPRGMDSSAAGGHGTHGVACGGAKLEGGSTQAWVVNG